MKRAPTYKPTALAALRFKRTPFPRPALLTAYADEGHWGERDRTDCAVVLTCAHAATRAAEGFSPAADVACDFAEDLHRAIAANAFESTRTEVAADRRRRLSQAVNGLTPAEFFSQAGQSPEVAQYAKAVCDALRVTPTAKWLARPKDACRYALARLYLAAGELPAAAISEENKGGRTNA